MLSQGMDNVTRKSWIKSQAYDVGTYKSNRSSGCFTPQNH